MIGELGVFTSNATLIKAVWAGQGYLKVKSGWGKGRALCNMSGRVVGVVGTNQGPCVI